MSLSYRPLCRTLALCAGAILATACADSTGPVTTTPNEGTATVWTGGPDAAMTGQQFGIRPVADNASQSIDILKNGSLAGAAPANALSISSADARALSRRTHRLRVRNPASSDGYDHLEIRPKSANSPASQVSLTRDGHVIAIVDLDYTRSATGWQLASIGATKYAADGRILERGRIDAPSGPRRLALAGLTNIVGQLLAPKAAHALEAPTFAASLAAGTTAMVLLDEEDESGCGAELRRLLLSIATMTVAGITNNPLGFFVGALGFANNLHAYASCMEHEQRPE